MEHSPVGKVRIVPARFFSEGNATIYIGTLLVLYSSGGADRCADYDLYSLVTSAVVAATSVVRTFSVSSWWFHHWSTLPIATVIPCFDICNGDGQVMFVVAEVILAFMEWLWLWG